MNPLNPLEALARVSLLFISTSIASVSIAQPAFIAFTKLQPGGGTLNWVGREMVSLNQQEDFLSVRSPNFWTFFAQTDGFKANFEGVGAEDRLVLHVRGKVTDSGPVLRVILLSPDWSKKAEWVFDVSDLSPDTFRPIVASHPMGKPTRVGTEPLLEISDTVGAIQILSDAKEGNQHWRLDLKELRVVQVR